MKQYLKTAAIIVAQSSLLGVSASWPGNTGQCVVDPQPGYNLTVLQICTTGETNYTTPEHWPSSPETYYMNGSLYSAFLTTGSDPLTAVQLVTPDWWVNTMQYAEYNSLHSGEQPTPPTQFYPFGYDLSTCPAFACQNKQPCAFWGNAGSPWVPFQNSPGFGLTYFTWWNDTNQLHYGPGKGYQLLDYVATDPPTLRPRAEGDTWFTCTPSVRAPCTEVNGAVVTYLYDCRPDYKSPSGKTGQWIPIPDNSGGINNKGDFECKGAEGAVGILAAAVDKAYKDSDIVALPGVPIYCNYDTTIISDAICVYYQGTATGNGTLTNTLLTKLHAKYGGDACGNIPIEYPEVDWLAFNYLTVSGNAPRCNGTTFDVPGGTACACPGFPAA